MNKNEKKSTKRAVALVLAISACIICLGGCGKKNTTATETIENGDYYEISGSEAE